MKRVLILCLFLSLSTMAGKCNTPYFTPLQPITQGSDNDITSNLQPSINKQNIDYSNISKIEQSLYGRTFADENIAARLSRLERSLFNRTYQNSSNLQRIDNIIMNYNQINQYPNISKNGLSKIEAKVLGQTYSLNSPKRRIERLEEQIFGAEQSGNLETRYEALKTATKNYGANNFYPTPSKMKQRLGSNLYNPFWNGGTITGLTPPITPNPLMYPTAYGYNNNTYNRNHNSNYNPYGGMDLGGFGGGSSYGGSVQSPWGTRVYDGFRNFGTGMGTGVTILD